MILLKNYQMKMIKILKKIKHLIIMYMVLKLKI